MEKIFVGVEDINPRQFCLNILSIWANKNNNKSTILNLIQTKLHMIYGGIAVNACVEYREEMFIGIADIHPDRQHFKIFCQFDKQK